MAEVTSQDFAMSLLDLDKDGKISRHDFQLLVQKSGSGLQGRAKAAHTALEKAVMNMCDAIGLVGDKSLSYDGYRQTVLEKLQNPTVENGVRQMLDAYFNTLDLNKNGYIGLSEYRKFMGNFKQTDPGEAEAAFQSIDKSGDGKIQREEWINYAFEFFFTSRNDLGSSNMMGSRCCCCCGCCCTIM